MCDFWFVKYNNFKIFILQIKNYNITILKVIFYKSNIFLLPRFNLFHEFKYSNTLKQQLINL